MGKAEWFARANISADPSQYDYRHIATTCSMDRIVHPAGKVGLLSPGLAAKVGRYNRVINVNTAEAKGLYREIMAGILDADPNLSLV